MSSRFPDRHAAGLRGLRRLRDLPGWVRPALFALLLAAPLAAAAETRALRVCADPDNLPFSDRAEAGFENRIARLVADALQATLAYEWQPQRRGFVRRTVGAGLCDVVIGVPTGFERLLTTRPYYRSAYAFVQPSSAARLESFDDPRLPSLRIGLQLIGNDLAATPPGHALARHGALEHVVGYTVYGDGSAFERMTGDLAAGRLDALVLWGPQAGYFASRSDGRYRVALARPPEDVAQPFDFAISMGVRRGDRALQQDLDRVIAQREPEIAAILDAYGVPRLPLPVGADGEAAR
jgi:mxaJ protein